MAAGTARAPAGALCKFTSRTGISCQPHLCHLAALRFSPSACPLISCPHPYRLMPLTSLFCTIRHAIYHQPDGHLHHLAALPPSPRSLSHYREALWRLMTEPDSSRAAHAASLLVMSAILISTAAFCLETLPEFSEERSPAAYEWVQGGSWGARS